MSTNTYEPLAEWCDQNAHRQFPLTDAASGVDTTGSMAIPQTFMVDMLICAHPSTDASKYFISSIVARRSSADVVLSYAGTSGDVIVGTWKAIPSTAGRNSVHYLAPATQANQDNKDLSLTTAALVVGRMDEILSLPGVWTFASAATPILESRVMLGLAGVPAIGVAGKLFTGDVWLQAGYNVQLNPVYDAALDAVKIIISATLSDAGTVAIASDADIIAALAATFGQPITTINGVAPASSGNFTLAGLDCTELNGVTNGVTIDNPCSKPCCDKSALQNLYDNLATLNQASARLDSYYQNVAQNVNGMQARLLALKD